MLCSPMDRRKNWDSISISDDCSLDVVGVVGGEVFVVGAVGVIVAVVVVVVEVVVVVAIFLY